jgi:hypothetical protein
MTLLLNESSSFNLSGYLIKSISDLFSCRQTRKTVETTFHHLYFAKLKIVNDNQSLMMIEIPLITMT